MKEAFETGPLDPRTWVRDPVLLTALVVGLLLRVAPLVLFPQFECLRDECIYRTMAQNIVDGQGLTVSNKGWLPSPGYPYLLAWSKMLFGNMQAVKAVQIALSLGTVGMIYGIARDVGDRRTARIAAWLFALNPTIAWFTNTMWIETIYIFFLMAAAVFMLSSWRSNTWQPAAWSGGMLGGAILFRGVATYLPPLWVLAAIYPTDDPFSFEAWKRSARERWRAVVACLVAVVIVVAPYSWYGSKTYGGFMVTDATVGHVLFLGNNDFPPLTFDYGNGMLTQPLYGKYLATGRRPCRRDVPPVESSKCEVGEAVAWVRQHPGKFLSRVPIRIAQLLNPNSFLTRHVRWGYWPGFPWWAKEGLAIGIVLLSSGLCLVGTVGAWARARGPFAMIAVGTTLYTVLTIALMYGMTRFRLPLEALWTVYLAMFLANPRESLHALRSTEWRLAGLLLTLPPVLALLLWYLPTGFPVFW
ncbi:MAG: glycosyltransferase family 39 protein [Myxococcota bacterium]